MSMCEQNLDRQLDAFSTFGVDGLFADRASGKDFERPEWLRPTAALRAGDVLVVKSIDRLGCGYEETIEQWRAITKETKADVVVLDMPFLDAREDRGGVDGRAHIRHRAAAALLRGPGGAREYPLASGGGHRCRQGARREVRQAEEEVARPLQKHQGQLPRRAYHQVGGGMLHQGARFRHRGCHMGAGRRMRPHVKRKGAKLQAEGGTGVVKKYTFLGSYHGPHYTHGRDAACKETAALHA